MNRQINTFLAIAVIVIVASAFGGLILYKEKEQNIASNIQQNVPTEKIQKNVSIPKIGEDCTSHWINGIETEIDNKNSLQCYFYDDVKNATDTTKPRKGVWIYPDEKSMTYVDYFKYIKNFEKFSNDIISFSYPAESRLDNWWSQDKRISLTIGSPEINPRVVNVEQQEDVFNLENFLANIKKNHSKVFYGAQNQSEINSTTLTTNDYRIDALTTTNIADDDVYFVFPRGSKYIIVSTQRTGDPYSDFLTEAFLQSIKVK